MRRAGSTSWRFAHAIDQAPLVALFVRDACGLPVPDDPAVPPRLAEDVPDLRATLDPRQRAAAGDAWAGWWRAVLAREARRHLYRPEEPPRGADPVDRAVRVARELRRLDAAAPPVFDPPEFAGLSDRPALRYVVRAVFPQALDWADARRQALILPAGRLRPFDDRAIRTVAERTVREHHVSPGAVHGCATIVPVRGIWWHRFASGAVVCSVDAACDPSVTRDIVADAFESGLTA